MAFTEIFSSWNIALIASILGVIMGIAWLGTSSRKKDKRNILGLFAVIGIAVFLIGGLMGTNNVLTNQISFGERPLATAPPTAGTPTTEGVCDVEGFVNVDGKCLCLGTDGDTTITVSGVNKWTGAAVGTAHRYRIDGVSSDVLNKGTFTASPGKNIDFLFGNETDGNYYGAVDSVVVPCAGAKTFSKELVQNGTLTIQVYNQEGNPITATENETLGAGDTVQLKMTLQAQYQRGFPNGGIIITEYLKNSTGYDTVEVQNFLVSGKNEEVGVPKAFSANATSHTQRAYYIPPFTSDNGELPGTLYIDVAGAEITPRPETLIGVYFVAYDYYVDDKDGGKYKLGAEDEDGIYNFGAETAFKVYVD